MEGFAVQILTPEALVFQGTVRSVVAPGLAGSFGVRTGHAPLISALQGGILKVETPNAELWFVISDGLLEVRGQETVILAGTALPASDRAEADRILQSSRT